MSELLRPGKGTTEHLRAWRCELTGDVLLFVSLVLLFFHQWVLVAVFAALGTALVLGASWVYIRGRSGAKASVSRPPVKPF